MLGDVSGKGAEAAAVSAATRYTLRALAGPSLSPAATLREVNAVLQAQTESERHCTLVHGHLRPPREHDAPGAPLRITLSLAGHHWPLVLRAAGEVEEVGTLGTALGLFDDPELHDAEVELAPGEVLCVFTDGLVEARRGAGTSSAPSGSPSCCARTATSPPTRWPGPCSTPSAPSTATSWATTSRCSWSGTTARATSATGTARTGCSRRPDLWVVAAPRPQRLRGVG